MARRPRLFAPGLLYHVIVRGNQKRKTFLDHQDYQVYLQRLAKYRKKYDYALYAYCLMPNHVHLLVESSNRPLAKFMQGLQQSYSQYFNLRHRKAGHVFQGRYKAIICEKDEYLLQLVRYIHLNPVRAKLAARPERYRYSGHGVYLDGKAVERMDPTKVLRILGGKAAYRKFVLDGMGEGHKEEYYAADDQTFLGADGFGEKVQDALGRAPKAAQQPVAAATRALAKELKLQVEVLRSRDRCWAVSRARTIIAYTLIRRMGYRLSDVSAYLQRDMATVTTLVARLWTRMQADRRLRLEVESIGKIVEI